MILKAYKRADPPNVFLYLIIIIHFTVQLCTIIHVSNPSRDYRRSPVGLTLARLLLNKPNVDFVVFESEKSRDARRQGGTLDLHPTTGLAALEEANLYDEFLKRARFDREALIICDKDLTKYVELSGSDENSSHRTPEIDHISLREMLLNSVPPSKIR
jgi:2-polyprenyl-6-methoxyphenol hydroxylase-like FAD-dependent oxidoreductase